MSKESNTKKTLFVTFQNGGQKKIIIPEGCKITFGPLCPGTKGEHNGNHATALRVYQGSATGANAMQIACFVKVESFYETDSVECVSKNTKKASKAQTVMEDGVAKQRHVTVEVSEWKNELEEDDDDNSAPKAAFAALAAEHAEPMM
jgi:hypothetical protein